MLPASTDSCFCRWRGSSGAICHPGILAAGEPAQGVSLVCTSASSGAPGGSACGCPLLWWRAAGVEAALASTFTWCERRGIQGCQMRSREDPREVECSSHLLCRKAGLALGFTGVQLGSRANPLDSAPASCGLLSWVGFGRVWAQLSGPATPSWEGRGPFTP